MVNKRGMSDYNFLTSFQGMEARCVLKSSPSGPPRFVLHQADFSPIYLCIIQFIQGSLQVWVGGKFYNTNVKKTIQRISAFNVK